MVSGICQVHALKNLQEVRLRWCDGNRTGRLNITFHTDLESIIPQRCQLSRVLTVVITLASLFRQIFFKNAFLCLTFPPPVQWGTYVTKIINRNVKKCRIFGFLSHRFTPQDFKIVHGYYLLKC